MILTCPECGTRYAVKDGAIPPEGRQVRCANCKHSWHQGPDETASTGDDAVVPAGVPVGANDAQPDAAHGYQDQDADLRETGFAEPAAPPPEPQDFDAPGEAYADPGYQAHEPQVAFDPAPPSPPPPAEGPPVEAVEPARDDTELVYTQQEFGTQAETAYEEPAPAHADEPVEQRWEPVADDQAFNPYASFEQEEPRRRGPLILLGLLLLVAAVALAVWYLAPTEFKQRLGIAQSGNTPLLVQVDERNRRTLESGNQLLEVSGKVINPTDQAQRVPPLQAQLRSLEQKVVYSWTIPPPTPVLAPGGSASFNSAELNIPDSAACLDVSFGDAPGRKAQAPCGPMQPADVTQQS